MLWQPVLVTPSALPVGALQGWLCKDQWGCLSPSQSLQSPSTILEHPVQGERGVRCHSQRAPAPRESGQRRCSSSLGSAGLSRTRDCIQGETPWSCYCSREMSIRMSIFFQGGRGEQQEHSQAAQCGSMGDNCGTTELLRPGRSSRQ